MDSVYRLGSDNPIPLCKRRFVEFIDYDSETNTVVNYTYSDSTSTLPVASPTVCISRDTLTKLEESVQPQGWVLVLMTLFAVVFFVGIIGNVLVTIAIIKYKFVRSVTAVFIASLAVSDIGVLLICLPVTVIDDVYHTWHWGNTMCRTIKFFQQFFVFVTILTLAMLAAERYATICYYSYGRGTRNYRKRRRYRDAAAIVIAVWLISAVLALPEVFRVTAVPVFEESSFLSSCRSNWPSGSDFALQLFYFGFLFLLPLSVITFCYYKIVRALIGNTRSGESENSPTTIALPNHQSCPSLLAPSTMFPSRSRSSSAYRTRETKISQLISDYSEPPYLQPKQSSGNNSRTASLSAAPASTVNLEKSNAKTTEMPMAQLKQRWRLTKMLITIVVLFVVSYLPVYVYLLIHPFELVAQWISSLTEDSKGNWRVHWDIKTIVALTVHFLVYVNSTVNPVIYYFMSDKFRQAFRKLLLCKLAKKWCIRRKEALVKQRAAHCYGPRDADAQQMNSRLLAQKELLPPGKKIPIIVVGNSNSSGGGFGAPMHPVVCPANLLVTKRGSAPATSSRHSKQPF